MARNDLKTANNILFGNLPKGSLFHAVTPDGRFVLGRDLDNKLVRWRVQDRTFTREETSVSIARPWLASNHPFLVSPDGKLVVHPINTKLVPKDDVQPLPASGFGLAAYKVADLSKPVFVFDTGAITTAVAFDKKTGLLCAHNKTKGLMLIDADGKLVREIKIDLPDANAAGLWNMVAHPDGGALLGFSGFVSNPKLMTIALPKDLPPVKNGLDKAP
jgi:hypothetical protein